MERSVFFVLLAFCCVSKLLAMHVPKIEVYSVDSHDEDIHDDRVEEDTIDEHDEDSDVEQVIKIGNVTIRIHNHPYGKPSALSHPEVKPEIQSRSQDLDDEPMHEAFPEAEPRSRLIPTQVEKEKDDNDEEAQPMQTPELPNPSREPVSINPFLSFFRLVTLPQRSFLPPPPPTPMPILPMAPTAVRFRFHVAPSSAPEFHPEEVPHPFSPRFMPLFDQNRFI